MTMDEFLRSMDDGSQDGAHGASDGDRQEQGELKGVNTSVMNTRDVLTLEIGLRLATKMIQIVQKSAIEHFGEDGGVSEKMAGECMIAIDAIKKVQKDVVRPMLKMVQESMAELEERRRKEEADGDE